MYFLRRNHLPGAHVSRSTVVNILKEAGVDPNPERKKGTWHDFFKRHLSTLWACDFFTKKVLTTTGFVEYYVLFFIHIGSRRVIVTGMTPHPDARWVAQQARNFILLTDKEAEAPTHLIHDFDTKFTKEFDTILAGEDIEPVKVGPGKPNLNSIAERFVLSIKSELLDDFVVLGEDHLRLLVNEYVKYYMEFRPHQGVGNVPLKALAIDPPADGEIVCHERLGGHLKHYERQAA